MARDGAGVALRAVAEVGVSQTTSIEWVRDPRTGEQGHSWNCVRGCSRVSRGCENCYAERIAARFSKGPGAGARRQGEFHGFARMTRQGPCWTGRVELIESKLDEPLRRRKSTLYFVNSMSDLFHERLVDDDIDKVFAVMALAQQHIFIILTKRAKRMFDYVGNSDTIGRVAKAADYITVGQEIAAMGPEEIRAIDGFPGYFITDRGRVLSSSGSAVCLFCGGPVDGIATKSYCSKKCRQNAGYYRRIGKARQGERSLTEMAHDSGEQGHRRVMLYRNGEARRELVHRLVLTAFDRRADLNEQTCHRDGNPENNALPNLRWGDQSENWKDRRRHGNGGISDLCWPLSNTWKGISAEDQATADERIPWLLKTPAAARLVSLEPLLGAVYIEPYFRGENRISWTICGGESGPGARPMNPRWARRVRDDCQAARVPYFHKQNGEWVPLSRLGFPYHASRYKYHIFEDTDRRTVMVRVGKKAAGRLLDGRTWDEIPEVK